MEKTVARKLCEDTFLQTLKARQGQEENTISSIPNGRFLPF